MIEGEGCRRARRAPDPQRGSHEHPRRRGRGARGRPAALSVPLRRRVMMSCAASATPAADHHHGAGAPADCRKVVEEVGDRGPEVRDQKSAHAPLIDSTSDFLLKARSGVRTLSVRYDVVWMTEPLSLRDLAEIGVGRLKGVGEEAAGPAPRWASRRCSTCSRTTRGGTSTARTRRESPSCVPGEEALVTRDRAHGLEAHDAQPPDDGDRRRVGDGSGRLSRRVLQPAVAGTPAPPEQQVAFFGKVDDYRGRLQMTNPVVDLIGDRTGPDRRRSTPSRRRPAFTPGSSATGSRRRCAKCRPRGIADPLPEPSARPASTSSTAAGVPRDPRAGVDGRRRSEARRRLVFDELLRVQLALVLRKRALEREAAGIRHEVGGELVRRFHDALPFPLTGAQRRRSPRSTPTSPAPHPCTGCCRATSVRARRSWPSARCSRGAGRAPGRVDGADRGAGRAARRRRPRAARRASTVPDAGRLAVRRAAAARRAAHQPHTAAERRASPPGSPTARSTS